MASQDIAFDRIADTYDESRGGLQRARAQVDLMLPLLGPTDPLLEIGVGTGLVATAVRERGRSVFGVDLSPRMLDRARNRLPGRVLVGNAARLPVATSSVPACYLIHVLHLVGDPAGTLAEAARVLRPGGRLVASVAMSTDGPTSDVEDVLTELEHDIGRPPRTDGEERIARLAGDAGLRPFDRTALPESRGYSPAEVAGRVEGRDWSWTWHHPDDVWAPAARKALERLRTLSGQDSPRAGRVAHALLAFTRPGL